MAKKILIATDGSEASMKAVRYLGETVMGSKDIKITVFSVLPEPPKGLGKALGDLAKVTPQFKEGLSILEQVRIRQEKELQGALEESKRVLIDAGIAERNIDIKARRRREGIARDIIREAEKGGYDTIVVGRRGISGAFFFGSVSDKIVKYAKNCAVWVVD